MTTLIGQSIGHYQVLEQLGEGGMAVVYKAYDTRLDRYVAVKVITPSREHSERFLKRFEREARALAKLSHPNIVGVIDYGEQNGLPYLVMEYIPAGTLKQKLGSPQAWQDAARTLVPIANALAYAHSQAIVHRDVKPSNILLTDSGDPMLTDFGIAKMLEVEETLDLTGTGVGVGTPEYMAPEQAQGRGVDARADVYSLGVVFYEMVTGRKPYQADTPMAVVWKLASEPLPRPTSFIPKLPESSERVILKALAKKADDRFQTMKEFSLALETLSQGRKISFAKVASAKPTQSKMPYLIGGVVLLSALLVGGLVFRDRLFPSAAQQPQDTQQSESASTEVQPTMTFVEQSVPTGTGTPASVQAVMTPVDLAAPISDFLTERYFRDDFDDSEFLGWSGETFVDRQNGYARFDGIGTWSGLDRTRALYENQIVNVTFKHAPDSEYEIYVQTGQWDTSTAKRWGIYGYPDQFSPNVYLGTASVGSDDWLKGDLKFESDHWYTLSLRIGQDGQFGLRITDNADPAKYLESTRSFGSDWADQYWVAHIAINQGTLYLDSYEELIISNLYTGELLPTAMPPMSVESTEEMEVFSTFPWMSTGIHLEQGQVVKIEASSMVVIDQQGLVSKISSPTGSEYCSDQNLACTLSDARWGALIGRIGAGEPFSIGNNSQFTVPSTGDLFLGVNDIREKFSDNQGSYKVIVSILVPK